MRQSLGCLFSALAGVASIAVILAFSLGDLRVVGAVAVGLGVLLLGGLIVLIQAMRSLDRRMHRHQSGRCVECGYDLRGSQESGRCPECGESFKIEPEIQP